VRSQLFERDDGLLHQQCVQFIVDAVRSEIDRGGGMRNR